MPEGARATVPAGALHRGPAGLRGRAPEDPSEGEPDGAKENLRRWQWAGSRKADQQRGWRWLQVLTLFLAAFSPDDGLGCILTSPLFLPGRDQAATSLCSQGLSGVPTRAPMLRAPLKPELAVMPSTLVEFVKVNLFKIYWT